MKELHPAEHDLVLLARALVGELPCESVMGLVLAETAPPEQLGPTAMALLQETLARGAVLNLGRRGGWRPRRHLSATGVSSGRLWDRHQPPALRFSEASFHLLRWLHGAGAATPPSPPPQHLATAGDELLGYLACHLLVGLERERLLARAPGIARSPLCWLGFADHLGSAPTPKVDFARLATGDHTLVLEALQRDLAQRWEEMERSKPSLTRAEELLALGRRQEAVLDALLPVLDSARRWDLALFLPEAVGPLLHTHATADAFAGPLVAKTISERSEGRRAAGAALRGLVRMATWAEGWRAIPFFEDAYQGAQAMLAAWEPWGDGPAARAAFVLRELESLPATPTAEPTAARQG